MDITEIQAGDRTIDVKHPATGRFIGLRISVVHWSDDRLKAVSRTIQDRRSYLEARGKTFAAEEMEENGRKITFAAMTGWEWTKDDNGEQLTFKGEIPDFNRKNVYDAFRALPWLMPKIDSEIGDEKAFFMGSSSED